MYRRMYQIGWLTSMDVQVLDAAVTDDDALWTVGAISPEMVVGVRCHLPGGRAVSLPLTARW
jgi:hypothetical protein